MSEPPDIVDSPEAPASAKPPRRAIWRRWLRPHTPVGWLGDAIVVAILAATVGLVVLRYGPLTTEARLLIEAQANGFQVGQFGKLRIEGVEGDVLRDMTVRRLTLSDKAGVWLQADDVAVRWRYAELLWRRLHIQSVTVGRLTIFRQPILTPPPPPGKGLDLSVALDRIKARIDTEPAFSDTRALYDFSGQFGMERRGATKAVIDLESVPRPGDYLKARLNLGQKSTLLLDAEAREVKGGGLAGSLGLASDRPFTLSAHISGALSQGRLDAIARSGDDTPLRAVGAWTPKGGTVDARLMLAQSKWTKGWANAAGPEVRISLTTKPRDKTLYDLDARLTAANLAVAARGPVDPAKRSSKGLGVSVVVNSLAKLVPQPVMGRGQITGVLSGALDDVRFAGSAEIKDFNFLDYRLARVAGPVKLGWRKRTLIIQATAAGSGASGANLIALAVGSAPTGSVEVDGLPDGRVLIKSMAIKGKGAKIDGAGGQDLIGGGLTFKGQMHIADVAAIRPGAAGALEASWSARQTKEPGAPWIFGVEAHGDRFATGLVELDRLLGPAPRLAGQAGFVGDVISFDTVSLEGAKAAADAHGQWKLDGAIMFALNWRADGPFAAGPLDIDGKAKGAGALTGTIGAPRLDLASELDTVNFPNLTLKAAKLDLGVTATPQGAEGRIALSGQSDYGPAHAHADFRLADHGLDLTGLDAEGGGVIAHGDLALRDLSPSTADLTLSLGPGAVLSEGQATGAVRITAAPGGAVASLNLQAKNAVVRGEPLALGSAKLTAQGPVAHLPYQISLDGALARTPLKLNGSGLFSQAAHGYTVAFDGSGQLRRANFHTLDTAQVRVEETERYARLRLALGGGRAELEARQGAGGANIAAVLTGVDLSFVSEDFTGQFDANLNLAGKGKDLRGALTAAVKNARSRDARAGLSIDGAFKAALDNDRLTVESSLKGSEGLTSSANFVLPVQASAEPFALAVIRDRPMQGHFEADGEIQPLWDLFLGGERTLGGKLAAKADVSGTIADPKITGRADLTAGRFEDYPTGLKLRDATLGAALNTDTILVDRFSAADGLKGSISGSGEVSLARGGGSNLLLKLSNFRLIDNDTATADASGQVTIVRGADGKAKIAGALDLVNGAINAAAKTGPDIPTIEVVEKNRPFNIQDQLVAPAPTTQPGVDLDVTLTARRGLLVKGRGLDLDMSVDARVTGTTSKPILDGDARVVRGDYDFGGSRFTFDNRGVVHLSNDPTAIRLDLTATREDPSLTAVITIKGTAAKPQISLSSTPVLPNDEVLSQVLFGSSASQLSPFQAAQLASALTALASGGGFDVIGGIRSLVRLDRLAVVGTTTTGYSVAGGKYLGDKFYVELAGGARDASYASVEYRITHNLSLVSRLANQPAAVTNTTPGTVVQTGSELSIRWRRDFRDKPPKDAVPAAKAP